MPRRDGTGPAGEGPRTGRGLGKCGPKKNIKSGIDIDNAGQGLRRGIRRISDETDRGQGRGQGSGRKNR